MSTSSSGRGPNPSNVATIQADPALASDIMKEVKDQFRPVLVVLAGPEVGRRVVLNRSMLAGRDPQADLALKDPLVSFRHLQIEDRGDSFALVDLGSRNGSWVNGVRVREAVLRAGDRIALGNTVIGYELVDPLTQAFNDHVERLLNMDDLTGLTVRRKFDADLAAMIERAGSSATPVGLLVMDMDGIKQINDSLGHLFGAYVIGEAGRLIGRVIAGKGQATRFGGDEFIAALPGLDMNGAEAVADEIQAALREHLFEREGRRLHPGISIGLAAFPESADSVEALFQSADEAMYRAKRSGKGRVSR